MKKRRILKCDELLLDHGYVPYSAVFRPVRKVCRKERRTALLCRIKISKKDTEFILVKIKTILSLMNQSLNVETDHSTALKAEKMPQTCCELMVLAWLPEKHKPNSRTDKDKTH